MYHVAICDDDRVFISYIKKIIKLAKDKEDCEYKIYEYFSGEDLVQHLGDNIQYDLLILDMQLVGIDGDETARRFRKRFPNAVLVFCSGVRPPTVKSFKATPFRYLLKSYSEIKFIHEMKEVLKEVERNVRESYIIGHYRNSVIKVRVKNILYIENAKRGSRVIVSKKSEEANFEGKILIDEKLIELSEKFEELFFAHSSYVVNLNHVEIVKNDELLLDSGEKLSISRTYYKTFREAFTKNIANKY